MPTQPFWTIVWPFLLMLLSIPLTVRYGQTWGEWLSNLIKTPLKFLRLNTIYLFFEKNKQLFVFAIVFYVLTSSTSFIVNKVIDSNSPLYIYQKLTNMEQDFLSFLWAQEHGMNIHNYYEGKLKDTHIGEAQKDELSKEIQKTWQSLQKKKLVKSLSSQNINLASYQLTLKGNRLYLSQKPKDFQKSFELFYKND